MKLPPRNDPPEIDLMPILSKLPEYRYGERRTERIQRAFDEGTTVGFALGVTASTLGWLIVSGWLVKLTMWMLVALTGVGAE